MRDKNHINSNVDGKTSDTDGLATSDRLVRQEDAALILGVTPRCMENWRHRGEGPKFVRISGRCIRYRKSDLYEWIEGRVKSSTSEA